MEDKPGIGGQSFKVKLDKNWFKPIEDFSSILVSMGIDCFLEDKSIKTIANEIEVALKASEGRISNEIRTGFSNAIKTRVQNEAYEALSEANDWGCVFMATGSGKSKIAVDKIVNPKIKRALIVVPTERLRDTGWMEEFHKWHQMDIWENVVERSCYASLNKYEGEHFDIVILDEGHNITENNSEFFKKNKVDRCIVLTATRPRDLTKIHILKSLNLNPIYELSLDEAVKLGIVAPYDITVVTLTLDDKEKYITAGRKDKPFMNTEKAQYGYLSKRLEAMPNSMGFINRMQFIYSLRSKTEAARWLLENALPEDLKTLIFCGSKSQANTLSPFRYYSRPSPPKKLKEDKKYTEKQLLKYNTALQKYREDLAIYQGDKSLNKFINNEIPRLACCDALNEGHNISDMDIAFIVQLDSNPQNFIQRIGRTLRFRPGHRGKIIILCVEDSIDKDWVKKATASLDAANISYVELSRLKMGIEKLLFD